MSASENKGNIDCLLFKFSAFDSTQKLSATASHFFQTFQSTGIGRLAG